MPLIADEVMEYLVGTGQIGKEQVKRWMKAQRTIYEACIKEQSESIDRYKKRIDELTNDEYETRIEALESQVSKLEAECYDWREKYQSLKARLVEVVEELDVL